MKGHGGKALPLNLAYLAGYLKQQKPYVDIDILDCEGLSLSYDQIENELHRIAPEVVGITVSTPAYAQVLEVARRIKKTDKHIKVVVGGPHPTALSEDTVKEDDIDIAVLGEGEITFFEIVNAIEKNQNIADVRGVVYKDRSGKIHRNPQRPMIKDLDVLPFPARELFPLEIYYPPPTKRISNKKPGNMITSRGCPYTCTYCMATVMWRHRVRFRSVGNVVDEIEHCVRNFGIGEINFHDELFTLKEKRTIEICREIRRRKLDIAWVCMVRVDYISAKVLREMKLAGCRKIMFGFESGSQMILDKM
ncbi:B12-binding domain-containing radical SAM protein, partial [Thermodesulfobacteriota bacterium]